MTSSNSQRDKRAQKAQRLQNANALLATIASCGVRFFANGEDASYFELDARGRVWFVDARSKGRIYTHDEYGPWRGFTNGGTLRSLVFALKNYVCFGRLLHPYALGPWPRWYCDGDLWSYGLAMETVRQKARELGILQPIIPQLRSAETQTPEELQKAQAHFKRLAERLAEMADMKDDWDGYKAKAPNEWALWQASAALAYASTLSCLPDNVLPSVENGVAIAYFENGRYADIEFFNDGDIALVTDDFASTSRGYDIRELYVPDALEQMCAFLRGEKNGYVPPDGALLSPKQSLRPRKIWPRSSETPKG
jgi:hypothetical protein